MTRGGCNPWSTFPIFPAPCVRFGSSQMVFHGNDRAPAALHHQSPAKHLMQARQSFPWNIPRVSHISGIFRMFRSASPSGFPGRNQVFPRNGGRIIGNILKSCQDRGRLDNREKFSQKECPGLAQAVHGSGGILVPAGFKSVDVGFGDIGCWPWQC